jgi:hypothetical protein
MPKKIEIDETQLKGLCRLKPRIQDVAAFFGCSHDTIERRVKELGAESFASFRDQNMVHTRFDLIRKAISKAMSGDNTMLIFCLKNLCGWADKVETTDTTPVEKKSKDQLIAEAKKLIEEVEE